MSYINYIERDNVILSIINNPLIDDEYKEHCLKIFEGIDKDTTLDCFNFHGDSLLRQFIIYNDDIDYKSTKYYDILKLLLEGGIDPNMVDNEGYSAFHHLTIFLNVKTMRTEYIDLFLKHGADINTRTRVGSTVFAMLCRRYNLEYYKDHNIFKIGETILDYVIRILYDTIDVCNINERGYSIATELFLAGDFKTLNILIKAFNKINLTSHIDLMVSQSLDYLKYKEENKK